MGRNYAVTKSMAELDFSARRALRRWSDLAEKGKKLSLEPKMLDGFQPEPANPLRVGLDELISDEYSPEELVGMFNRPPLVFDWDEHQSTEVVI